MEFDAATLMDVHLLLVDAEHLLLRIDGMWPSPARRRALLDARACLDQVGAVLDRPPIQVHRGHLADAMNAVDRLQGELAEIRVREGIRIDAPDASWFTEAPQGEIRRRKRPERQRGWTKIPMVG